MPKLFSDPEAIAEDIIRDVGTNLVVGTTPDVIKREAEKILKGEGKKGRIPDLWDGHAAERIAELYGRVLLGLDIT